MALSVTSAPWQQVPIPALDLRRYLGAGLQEGVVSAGDMAVAQRAAGANYSVDIAAGEALVQGDSISNQGRYYVFNDAVTNVTGFTAAHATLPRIDRVALRVRDAFHGDAANDVSFQIVTGTATSGATLSNLNGAAAVPNSQLLLANVLIPATATTVTTANIDTTVRQRIFSLSQIPPSATNGQFITTVGGAVAWGAGITYSTTLPGSPTDGQEVILVDSTTAPTYQWRLRYNSGSSNTDKWEFVGGPPASVVVAAAETTTSTTYADLTTTGPSFTVPRGGLYEISLGCEADVTVFAARSVSRLAAKLGAAATADSESAVTSFENTANVWSPTLTLPARTLAASDVVKVQYKTSANTARFARRFLSVRPVRVS